MLTVALREGALKGARGSARMTSMTKCPVMGPRWAARTAAGRRRVNGQGSNRMCRMRAIAPWVGDDLENTLAASTCSAAGDVEREDAGEELGSGDATGSG